MISVIVATYNRPADLCSLLAALRNQTEPVEVVVADDGTKSPSVQGDRYLWRKDDGYHKSWMVNQAVRMASGDVLAFLDDDCLPVFSEWAVNHLKALQDARVSRGPFGLCRKVNGRNEWLNSMTFGTRGAYWSCINTVMSRDVWNQVGGYDERFDGAYGFEDIDFGLTIQKLGLSVAESSRRTMVEHSGEPYCIRDGQIDESISARNKELLEEKWGSDVLDLMERSGR